MGIYADGQIKKIDAEGLIKKVYVHHGPGETALVFSAANTVTYLVDTDVSYTEEVEYGESCLSPTSFSPIKSGYEFVGWREDKKSNKNVLNSKVMDTEPITLYAVFKKTITLSYDGNGASEGSVSSQTGTRVYNNGNHTSDQFKLKPNGFTKTNCTFSKWARGSASGTQYAVDSSVVLSEDTTFYAVWDVNSKSNEVLYSDNGKKDTTTVSFDTTNYNSVEITLSIESGYGYGWLESGTKDFNGAPVQIQGKDSISKTISLPANSGMQKFSFRVGYNGDYGGKEANTSWEITVTAK